MGVLTGPYVSQLILQPENTDAQVSDTLSDSKKWKEVELKRSIQVNCSYGILMHTEVLVV